MSHAPSVGDLAGQKLNSPAIWHGRLMRRVSPRQRITSSRAGHRHRPKALVAKEVDDPPTLCQSLCH